MSPPPRAAEADGFDTVLVILAVIAVIRGNFHLHIHRLPRQQKQLLNPKVSMETLGRQTGLNRS